MSSLRLKYIDTEEVSAWRSRQGGLKIVATNGCFDLLHIGHVEMLEAARAFGDLLIVGINSDASVRSLKGASRPVHDQAERAAVIAALACVDAVTIFNGLTAVDFLKAAKPHIWVKGGDYSKENVNESERAAFDGSMIILPYREGRSTTAILTALVSGNTDRGDESAANALQRRDGSDC